LLPVQFVRASIDHPTSLNTLKERVLNRLTGASKTQLHIRRSKFENLRRPFHPERTFYLYHDISSTRRKHPILQSMNISKEKGMPAILSSVMAEVHPREHFAESRAYLQGAMRDGTFYQVVLEQEVPWIDSVVRARPLIGCPSCSRATKSGLRLHCVTRPMAMLMYRAGLRLLECARLRVKDVDFASSQITVRSGKGGRDRVTMLPAAVRPRSSAAS
jgi:integrase